MIGAGQPAGVVTLHAVVARQDVLNGVIQGMAQMQGRRHVRRGDDDRIRIAAVGRLGVEALLLLPDAVGFGFDSGGS